MGPWVNTFKRYARRYAPYIRRGARYAARAAAPYAAQKMSTLLSGYWRAPTARKSSKRATAGGYMMSTPGGKNKLRVSQTGAMASKSAGFFGKGTRKYKRKALVKYSKNNGVNHTIESNNTATGVDTVWIGHHTFPYISLYKQAVKVVFKALLARAGVQVISSTNSFPELFAGAVIRVEYRVTPQANIQTADYTFGAGAATMDDFVTWFLGNTRPWSAQPDTQFVRMEFLGAATPQKPTADVVLSNFLVKIAVKSTLKLQNRSKNQLGALPDGNDQTEESDVVPLYGKSYYASGTELKTRKTFIGDTTSSNAVVGEMYAGCVFGVETDNSMKEPPQGYSEFSNVKKVGKAHLDPGQIKTSVLQDTYTMYFNTFQFIYGNDPLTNAAIRRWRTRGHLRVFCLEKMINTNENFGIVVAYENNTEISCSGKEKRVYCTVKSFEKTG